MFDPLADINSGFVDFPFRDPEYPASGGTLVVDIGATAVVGNVAMAAGPGTKGTVIITPPPAEADNLESLIIPLTYSGINVVTYFPRGTSRDETYSEIKAVEDLHGFINWIVVNSGKKDAEGRPIRLDPSRIALLGLGQGGGNVSLAACAESKVARYAIGIAAGNPEVQLTSQAIDRERPMYRALKEATHGDTDVEAWNDALTPADKGRLSVIRQAPKLVDKHLLLIGASRDVVSPIATCHKPNVSALRKAGAKHLTEVVLDTDHLFLTKRYALAQQVISWLRTEGSFSTPRDA